MHPASPPPPQKKQMDEFFSEVRAEYSTGPAMVPIPFWKGVDFFDNAFVCVVRHVPDVMCPISIPISALPDIPGILTPLSLNEARAVAKALPESLRSFQTVGTSGFCALCHQWVLEKIDGPCRQCEKCHLFVCASCVEDGSFERSKCGSSQGHTHSREISLTGVFAPRYCDLCEDDIEQGEEVWTTDPSDDACPTEQNGSDSFDVCLDCKAAIDAGDLELDTNVLCLLEKHVTPAARGLNEALGVGELADWIPVARDVSDNTPGYLLVNTNPTAVFQTALCLGKSEFCATSRSLDDVLDLFRDLDTDSTGKFYAVAKQLGFW